MTIASEITRIKNNIASAYTACRNQGATIPATQNSANLASCISTIGGGGMGIPRGVDSNGVYGYPTNFFSFATPSNATSLLPGVFQNAFSGCTTITSVDLSSLTEITGSYTMSNFCDGCTNLTSIDLSNVATVDGSNVMNRAFAGTGITSVDLSSLQTISGTSAMNSAFYNCPNIASIDLSGLTSLPNNFVTMAGTFALSSNPTSPLPLASVTFTSLATVNGTAPMRNIFQKRDGLVVYFPAFNSRTFGNLTTYLNGIFNEAVGCTVHFPSNMQAIIGNWSSVINGYGGTNTTTLFDLPATS